MKGEFRKTASGFNSYELANVEENYMYKFADVIVDIFQFEQFGLPVVGGDGVYWDFFKDGVKLVLGWDIWSGCFIMSDSLLGDKYVSDIGIYINDVYLSIAAT